MPFSERVRNWAKEVAGGKCQTMVYTEEHGWQPCGRDAQEIDHNPPESYLIYHHLDRDNAATPVVRCKMHHTGQGLTQGDDGELEEAGYGEFTFSKHPDIYQALEDYRAGDKNAFKKAAKKHQEAVENGENFTNTDWQIDEYEKERMNYLAQQSGKKRPFIKRRK